MNKHIAIMCSLCMAAAFNTARAQFTMDPDSATIDLGYGIMQTIATSSVSISVISGDELRSSGAISVADALYGRLLGLTALNNGGFEGDESYGARFNIRGYQTMSENNIITLVDGVQRPINRLTVDEVESVTVLKDAAAVALLGYEGVNGAILVKTRHGQNGRMNVDLSYRHEFLFSPKVADFVNAYDYATAMNEARLNDGLPSAYSPLELELYKYETDPYVYPNVDWRNEVMKDRASQDEINLAISGGNQSVKYFTMLDYTNASGALKGTNQPDYNSQLRYSKANIRANLDFTVTPTTFMNVNMLANFIETANPASGGASDIMYRIYSLPANAFPVRLADGTWGGNQIFNDYNPVARIQATGREKTHQRALYADARLTQKLDFITPGLSGTLRVVYDNLSIINERHSKSFQYGFQSYGDAIGDYHFLSTTLYGDKVNNLEYSKWMSDQWRSSYFSANLNYDRTFDRHRLSAAAIYNTISTVGMGRHNTINRANVMAYLGYVWDNKFAANAVLAANGSNRSYPHKWSFSPTFSLAYAFVNEPSSQSVNLAKLRASFGIQHSDYVPIQGIWLENYDGGHGNIVFKPNYDGNYWGSYLTHYPLTEFDLETAYKYNIGADLRLFGALQLTAEAYYNRRSNIMMSANDLNSWVVGRPNSYATKGKVDNYGIEIGANYSKHLTKDFVLNVGAMFTWGRNKIKDYIEIVAEDYQSHIGQRVDQAFGLEAIGFFMDQADIDASPKQQFASVKPGDIKYKDQNGDGIINEHDAQYMGYGQNVPDTNYAFSLGLEYKGFGFNAIFQGAAHMTAYLGTTGVWRNCLTNNGNLSQHYYENAWKTDGSNATTALYPRLTTQDNPNNNQSSSVWYKDINWFKLRNLELYYRLPKSILGKIAMNDMKIFVQGRNLFTSSNMKVMDPEAMGTQYPIFKGINAGFTVNF